MASERNATPRTNRDVYRTSRSVSSAERRFRGPVFVSRTAGWLRSRESRECGGERGRTERVVSWSQVSAEKMWGLRFDDGGFFFNLLQENGTKPILQK